MSTLPLERDPAAVAETAPVLEVVIPVYNEETVLADSVRRVVDHLATLPWSFRVTIADNASTDGTEVIARRLGHEIAEVRTVHLAEKGRGRALRRVWSSSDAEVLVYMDVDLSTDLGALLPLVAPLISGHSDLAIGSRLAPSARVERGLQREVISRGYNLILRGTLRVGFSDAQCGFKAIRREAAEALLPLVEDQEWFFDTELLTVAERAGLRIHEVPVDWVDDPDSRVDILRTAYKDLCGVWRLGTNLARGRLPLREVGERLGRISDATATGRLGFQAAMFVIIGVLSTVAYALLYLGLRQVFAPLLANLAALLITAIANTAANRRYSFGVRGGQGALRHQAQGLLVFVVGLAFTTSAILLLGSGSPPVVEMLVLTVTNLVVTVLRFAAMRWWMFARR
jgi:glycosyltransferase involved in cell wall biosynthesis/putative flippase GtrA